MTGSMPPPHASTISGEISRMPSSVPLRVLAAMTGLLLIKNLLFVIGRYLLALRGKGTLILQGDIITLSTEWSLMGRPIRRSVTMAPVRDILAIQFENRQRYLYLIIGFGFLVAGVLVGAQWFLDGLRAGYPFLTLVGAIIVVGGVAVDLAIYLFVPIRGGRTYLIIAQGPWVTRLRGVEAAQAERLVAKVQAIWGSKATTIVPAQ